MLEKKIADDMKSALKNGEKLKLSVLRMLISEMKNKRIADMVKELDDDRIIGVIQKMIRQRKESVEQFTKGGRMDLADKEKSEADILGEYLPAQLTAEELKLIVSDVIKNTGAVSVKEMGKVMNAVISAVKGRADSGVISGIVRERLSQSS